MSIIKSIDKITITIQIIILIIFIIYSIIIFKSYLLLYYNEFIICGLLSGSLHALTGPDHLAALLPSIVNKHWFISLIFGLTWGIGHSLSVSLMCLLGYILEDSLLKISIISYIIQYADVAVGITLLIIGCLGVLEATNTPNNDNNNPIEYNEINSSIAIVTTINSIYWKYLTSIYTTFLNGLLLGLSWDSLPSIAPALTASSWYHFILFLLAYGFGTTISMGFVSLLIGLTTTWLGNKTSNSIPLRLAFSSSIVAVIIGLFWIGQASLRIANVDDTERAISIINYVLAAGAPIAMLSVIVGTICSELNIKWNRISLNLYNNQNVISKDDSYLV